jgi:hypothetical protein
MKLPVPGPRYEPSKESERNRQIEQADRFNHKRGQDVYISPGMLFITSSTGEKWPIVVTETGQVTAGLEPSILLATKAYGQLFYPGGGSVTINTAGTYEPTGLTGDLDTSISTGIGLGVSDELGLKNVSDYTIRVPIYASYDGNAGNNKILGLKLALNGTAIDETECRAASGSVHTIAKLVTRWIVELEPGDEVSIMVTNHTDTSAVNIDRARMIAG